jgi:phosphoglucosamine mutase
MEAMKERGLNIGGEQSGHLILGDYSTTGDALIAALQILAGMLEDGRPASQALRMFEPVPQILKNVRFSGVSPLTRADVAAQIAAMETTLGAKGRIVVRPSGTEPLLRIMIEGEDPKAIEKMAEDLANLIAQSLAA